MRAMILAAGLGTRMRPLTLTTPKPLLPVNDQPLIYYHIQRLRDAGVTELVINHAWLGEQIETALGNGDELGVTIRYSAEAEPLETAGGIKKALPLLVEGDEPFLVVNGDVFSNYPFSQLLDFDLSDDLAHLVLVDNPEHNPKGDFCLQDDRIVASGERALTFSGISCLSPRLFDGVVAGQPAALAPLLRDAICQGRISGEYFSGFWADIGTPQRLTEIDHAVREGAISGL